MSSSDEARRSADQLDGRLELEMLISEASGSLFAAPPEQLDHYVERILDRARDFFRADRCALLTVSADQDVVKVRLASYAEGVAPVPTDANLAEAFPWSRRMLLVEREPVRVSRLDDLPVEAHVERQAWLQMSIRSALTLPIETGGIVRYLIVLNTVYTEREWPDAFVTRLRLLGEILAGALERQEMFDALRALEARAEAGADLAGLAFYEVNFAEGTALADRRFSDLCGLPPDRNHGLGPLEFWLEQLHPDDRPRVLAQRRQLHDGELTQASVEYRFLNPVHGERWVEHLACVAERDEAQRSVLTYGVLRDITERKRAENELSDLSRRLIRAHEDERALLARELHDDVTQRLAVLSIEMGRVEQVGVDSPHAQTVTRVREELVRLSEDIHSLAHQLHPSVLDELGLVAALRAEGERLGRQNSVEISVDIDPLLGPVGEDVALCVLRVAQEALRNVIRHAGATAASVTLRGHDGVLALTVSDDGVGFDAKSVRAGMHLGLASMRERVRLVNGTLDIESGHDRGTSIVAWIPTDGQAR